MDRLKVTDIGGFPVVLDDLAFLQDAIKGAFQGIGSVAGKSLLAADGFIISGCERTIPGGVTTIQSGFIYLKGEVFKVDLHTFTEVPSETEHWVELETNDPAGNKVFQDTVSHDTYKIRKAHVISDASPPGDFMPAEAKGIGEVMILAKGSEAKFIMAWDFNAADNFTTATKTIQTFVPSADQSAILGMAIWQFHVRHPNLAVGTKHVCTFRIDRNAVNLQNSVHTVEDDGKNHIITLIAFMSYNPGDVINCTASVDVATITFVNGFAGFISLSASK